MIVYEGRKLPCFLSRKGCTKMAAFRVEGQHLIMHVCADHKLEAAGFSPPSVITSLATSGADHLAATSLDNASLRQAPHILAADDE